jgi:NDP-sugar pyrophosphorylase family protein
MQALILAGGQGTRLRPLTLNTPKPVVPIGNRPFLLRQIQGLKTAGITDITLSLNYQPSAIEKILGDGTDFGVNLRYLTEPKPMGTAGGYKFAEEFLKTTTVVLNGDILTDIDFQTVARHHKKNGAAATIVLTEVENPSAYGVVEVGQADEVLRFLEKPKLDGISEVNVNTINAGIYILEPKVLNYIPANENYSFEYDLFPDLLRRREKFYAFVESNNYWLDIGTPQRYLQAHYDLLDGKLRNFQIKRNNAFDVSGAATIDDKSCIENGCVIKSGAQIVNSVLGKNVVVESGAVVQNSVIWAGTKIGSDARVFDSIIGCDCNIGENVSLGSGSVIGDREIFANSDVRATT